MAKPLPSTNKRNDGYVGILFFTALIMGGGVLLMYMENDEYQFDHEVKAATPQKISNLQKLKPAAPDTPAPAPAPMPDAAPQSRTVPVPPKVAPAPVAVVAPPAVPVETTPTPRTSDASAAPVKPETKPADNSPPMVQPGFTLPRRR